METTLLKKVLKMQQKVLLIGLKDQWKITNEFYTDEGVVRDGKFFANGKSEGVPIENAPVAGVPEQGPRHLRNFIDCVRSRKREDLNAEILEGHQTALLAHLGNISYRLGKDVPFDTLTRPFNGDGIVRESFEDMKRHPLSAKEGSTPKGCTGHDLGIPPYV